MELELLGFKDKMGNEYKFTISSEKGIDIKEVEPKPTFKVGDWARWIGTDAKTKSNPFRIAEIRDGNRVFGEDYTEPPNYQCDIDDLRPVTPAEVEAHLRSICDKKGFRSGIKIRGLNYEGKPYRNCYVIEMPATYIADEDCMLTESGDRIYCQGQFAEILPEHKKEFPKTVEELIDLIRGFGRSPIPSVSEFLKEQGYTD